MPANRPTTEPATRRATRTDTILRWLLVVWMLGAILIGALLVSYHQPFQAPDEGDASLLALAPPLAPDPTRPWRAVHFLSGSCGCSQRVMAHLLARHPLPGVQEQILLIDNSDNPDNPDNSDANPEPYLPGTANLLTRLKDDGFQVTHLPPARIPANSGLHGVPLLLLASSGNTHKIYLGGYGRLNDQDTVLLAALRQGRPTTPLPILGCAVGAHLRRTLDPLHLKY